VCGLDTEVKPTGGVLPWVFLLTSSYFLLVLVVGFWIGSLTLQADAFHMASDVLALEITMYSNRISGSSHTDLSTFGFGRYDIIGAFANTIFLLSIGLFMLMVVGGWWDRFSGKLSRITCIHCSGASHSHSNCENPEDPSKLPQDNGLRGVLLYLIGDTLGSVG